MASPPLIPKIVIEWADRIRAQRIVIYTNERCTIWKFER